MFYAFLPKLLNMSITGGVIILAVLLARLLLRKAPKVFSYALWAVALFRLLCPVSVSSPVSVLNLLGSPAADSGRMEYIPENIVHAEYPAVNIAGVGGIINGALPQGEEQLAADPLEVPVTILTCIWFAGAAALLLYSIVKLLQLKRALVGSLRVRSNIYLADHIASPCVLGVFRPKIYLPSSLSEKERRYIIFHEQYHIRRLDHIIRILAFLALCVHWFNPLVWAAFLLSGRDMEMSCDEAVMKKLGGDIRADYARSLVSLATGRRTIAGSPLAFGEGNPKSRVKNVLSYKKPAFWVVAAAVIVCVIAAVCLLTNPAGKSFDLAVHIPAEEEERVFYTDEEVSSQSGVIEIVAGQGLGDTMVWLLPAGAGEESVSVEPQYITPGMPVKFQVEKNAWFRVGIGPMLVESAEEEYITVKNVEVRIQDAAASDEDTPLPDANSDEDTSPPDTNSAIGALIETIYASPASSSNPEDYIDAHSAEYQELINYGEDTLRYCFSLFEQGGETELDGQIMMRACEEIAESWGEAPLVFNLPFDGVLTGHMWYSAFKNNALSLMEQYTGTELAERYPASYLLLGMLGKL